MVRVALALLLGAAVPWITPEGAVVHRSPSVPEDRVVSVYDACTGTVVGREYVITAAHCVGYLRVPVRLQSGRLTWGEVVWNSWWDHTPTRDEDRGLDVAVLRLEEPMPAPYRPRCLRRPTPGEEGYLVSESPFGRRWRAVLRNVTTSVDSDYGRVAVWYGFAMPGVSGSVVWSDRGCILGMIWYGAVVLKLAAGADGLRLWEVIWPWLE